MALIKKLRGFEPQIATDVYLAETATLIGEVEIAEGSSIWFGAVLRGDVGAIKIGRNSNIQDGCVLHATFEKSIVEVGDNVTVGHNAIIHGAKIGNNVLVGMGSVVLDNVVVGENTIIAAGAVVTKNSILEPNSIYAGTPAKKIKELDEQQAKEMMHKSADAYQKYSKWYEEEC
jgi:carbonic anhydrase/acetyltransferase-like protein (isoleucine patch superfamily)